MLPQPWRGDKADVNGGRPGPFNRGMKYLAGVVLACAGAAAAAPQPQQPPKQPPPRELRQVLQQYHPAATQPPPRQLTPPERAELRRQLGEYGAPPRR